MTRFAAPIAAQIWDMKYRLKDAEGNPLRYDKMYYIGETDFYIPRDEDGNFKSYASAAESLPETLDVMRGLVPTHVVFNGAVGAITGENSIVRRWLRAGADGWRLDVADELPDSFIADSLASSRTRSSRRSKYHFEVINSRNDSGAIGFASSADTSSS